jgi:hypothetical protein
MREFACRFLTYDRKVLRFYAIWDDRNSIFGGKHFITLRYYLFDYTIDMQERHGSADGQKTRFLMRQRIPTNSNQPLTHEEQRTGKTGFITLDDLFIGARIDVFGKKLFIYDADEFTKRYFSSQLGKGMQSIDISEPSVPIPRLPTPPSNGLGAEDDSIQNCKMLRPKPLYRDMAKYKKFAGKVMRFTARWNSERPEESSRSFIISFFPADDTVSIWETSGDGYVAVSDIERKCERERMRERERENESGCGVFLCVLMYNVRKYAHRRPKRSNSYIQTCLDAPACVRINVQAQHGHGLWQIPRTHETLQTGHLWDEAQILRPI